MLRRLAFAWFLAVIAWAVAVSADWDPSMPRKWVQYPDLSTLGVDVSASENFILADDFLCTEPGPITSIHIWGSWWHDIQISQVSFVLSLHADIPDSESPTGYSMPGDVLWYRRFNRDEFTARVWRDSIAEGWMEPPEGYEFPGDHVCWQYNFPIPASETFYQQGTVDHPVVYWLNVAANPQQPDILFGWKTAKSHWNDDAVWGRGSEPYYGPWYELRYPPGHQLYGQSIDLAFVIVGDTVAGCDWGDAPDWQAVPGYPTLAINGGANHIISGPWLGDATDFPDGEYDGQPDPNAWGDDNVGNDDEDGVQVPVLVQGQIVAVQFEIGGANGALDGWIDFNGDKVWQHPGEQVVATGVLAPGPYAFSVAVPPSSVVGQTFARFRISSAGGLSPQGGATDGEVEDYEVHIDAPSYPPKWIQPPDLTPMGIDVNATEQYVLADDFLCTEPGRISEISIWGSWINDSLPFGDPTAVDFTLSFHADIPDSESTTGYSMPGQVLWFRRFVPGQFTAGVWQQGIEEGWMDPPEAYTFPGDHVCWHYRFLVDPYEAFFQTGSPNDPIVYWLDVQAVPHDPGSLFGWKTSDLRWNDDAVWGQGAEPYLGPWFELRYPPNHPYYPMSIDLAFRLANEPTSGLPVGDAVPEGLGLFQNAPNPFRASTTIQYVLSVAGHVRLEVYDVTGRIVSTLVDEPRPAGLHTVTWNGRDRDGEILPTGVYFCRLVAERGELTQKLMFLK